LTSTGRRLLLSAENMEQDALSVERLASGRNAGLRGRVTLTASEWLIQRLLAPVLAPMLARNTELEVELWADVRHLSLARREADIAIRPSRFEHADIVQRALGVLVFGLYASDGYLASEGMPDFERQAEGHRLVAMSEALGKIPDLEFIPKVASRARVVARANGREPMVTLVSAGVGIACLPRFVGDAVPGLRHLSTPEPEPERRLWLGFHEDARATPRVRVVSGWLTDAFTRLGPALKPQARP
jgi:DNA-binding transcriptional LysR family regulator